MSIGKKTVRKLGALAAGAALVGVGIIAAPNAAFAQGVVGFCENVSKTADVTQAAPGDLVTYNISFQSQSQGLGDLTFDRFGCVITDQLPSGVTLVDAGAFTALDADTLEWRLSGINDLAGPGPDVVTKQWSTDVTVRVNDDTDGDFTNSVWSRNVFPDAPSTNLPGNLCSPEELARTGGNALDNASCVTVTAGVTAAPGLSLDKRQVTPATYAAGDTIAYEFEVTNTGNTTLTGVTVTETSMTNGAGALLALDDGIIAPAGFTGTLAPGESAIFTGAYTVTQADVAAGLADITNTATVTSDDGTTNTDTDTADVVDPNAAVTLDKTVTNAGQSGFYTDGVIHYTFTVVNTGNVTLTGVNVTEGAMLNGAGTPLTLDDGVVAPAGFDGTLAPGATAEFTGTYTVTEADVLAGTADIVNTATVTTDQDVTDEDTISTDVLDPSSALTLDKRAAEGTYAAGDTIAYEFEVTNTGNTTLTGVSVAETSMTNGAGALLALDDGIIAPAGFTGTLAPGESAIFTGDYTVTQSDVDAGLTDITNTARVTGTDGNNTPVTSTDTHTTDVADPVASLAFEKDITNQPADGFAVGETVDYTFTATNTGNSTLSDVTVSEVSMTTKDGKSVALDGDISAPEAFDGTLAPGESATFTGKYTLTSAQDVRNVALAEANGVDGTRLTTEDDADATAQVPAPAPVPEKSTLATTGGALPVGLTVLGALALLAGAVLVRRSRTA